MYCNTRGNEVTSIIRNNRKRFECPEFLFAEDSGLLPYSGQKLKVLILFLSNGRYRSSSNTFNILQDIISSNDVFVDFCYFPHPSDLDLYEELKIPYVRGSRSGFLIKDFDVVLVSIAVLKEVVNLPVIYHHDNIPMGIQGRKKENYPIIAMGGSSAHVLSIACGDFMLNGTRDRSLVDIVNFGKGGKSLRELVKECLKWDSVTSHRDDIVNNLGSRWLNIEKLKFEYDSKGYIVNELSGQKAVLDRGEVVDENFNHKILNLDGSFTDRADVLISYGCNGRGYCSFCLEGATGGCWKEKSIKDIERDIIESKFNLWQESCGVFSYNANYHSQIEHIAELTLKYFDRSSVLMSRADVYSKSNKYIDICKKLGTIKLSIAAEGMSDKIRNDFLNKRLSREELHNAVHNLMSNEILTIKINYILTGKETEEDFKEWVDDITQMLFYKKEHEYKTRISLTITNLVIYDMTPLRYEKRMMSLNSIFYKESGFIRTFLYYSKQISSMGVGVTIYGTGMVSAFEQLILDLGYMGTSILINSVVKDGLRYDRDVTKAMCDKFFKRVSTTYLIEDLFDERGVEHWFPSSMIDYGNKNLAVGVRDSYRDISCEKCINPCK
jgi:hypothetical protein